MPSGPNSTIDNVLITQFSAEVHTEAQQMKSRTRAIANVGKMTGDVWAYDGLGTVEAREVNARYAEATFDSIEHTRRKIVRRKFVVNLPIDDHDVRGALLDPQNQYPRMAVYAMARVFDRVFLEAALADVKTGREFGTTKTFAQDGGLTVDATGGFTYEKLLEIRQNFTDNDIGNDMPSAYNMMITGDEETALMKELELTSGDFSRKYVVDRGEMESACGINLVKFAANADNPLLSVAGGVRSNICVADNAVKVGISKDFQIKVQERNDYIDTTQVQVVGILGAVRTEGVRVQKVTTTD